MPNPTAKMFANGKQVSTLRVNVGDSITWNWKATNASKFDWEIRSSTPTVYPSKKWAQGSSKSGSAGPYVVPPDFAGATFVHTYTATQTSTGKKAVAKTTLIVAVSEGALVKVKNSANVWQVHGGKRFQVPSLAIFNSYGWKLSDIAIVSARQLHAIPVGTPLRGKSKSDVALPINKNISIPANKFCTNAGACLDTAYQNFSPRNSCGYFLSGCGGGGFCGITCGGFCCGGEVGSFTGVRRGFQGA